MNIAAHNNLDEYQNNFAEWRKPEKNTVWFHLHKILENVT